MTAPRPTQRYDVAVLGDSLPGLVAAALLAQQGLRVLHVAPTQPGTWESGGWRLPLAPELLPSPRLLPAIREILELLSLAQTIGRQLEPLPVQLLLPRSRFELLAARELRRALGDAAPAIVAGLAASVETMAPAVSNAPLLPAGPRENLALWRHRLRHRALLDAPLALEGELGQALLALHHFVTPDAAPPGALSFARSTAPLLHGFHRLPEGGLAAQLVGHVRARRGDALVANVDEIVLEGGRFAGLQIRGELWRAKALIAAMPASRLAGLLPEGKRRDRLSRHTAGATVAPRYVRSFVIGVEGLPPGLGPLALVARGRASAILDLRRSLRSDGNEDASVRTLTVASFEGGAALEALLEEVLPFHRDHIRHAATAPASVGSIAFAAERQLGFEGLPIRTPIPGLLLGGPELLPGLGVEGAFLAGKAVAAAARLLGGA